MKKAKLIALLAAVAAAILIFFFFTTLSQTGGRESTSVITAAALIPANTTITEEMIAEKKVPNSALVSGAVEEKKLVLGRMAKADIYPGEQVLENKLILPGDKGNYSLAYSLEPGMRAISVSVDATTGISGMLKPQNRVDLICDFELDQPGGEPKSYSTLVAENIKILAVDDVLSEQGKASIDEAAPAYSTITLEVTPKQSMEISMAVYEGQLRTVLRSPLDENMTNLPNLTIENVMVN